jgi:hypothetical protein
MNVKFLIFCILTVDLILSPPDTSSTMRTVLTFFIFLIAVSVSAQVFQNGSLEQWNDTLCEKNIPPFQWNNFTNLGLGPDEGNFLLCPSTVPVRASDGHVYARMMAGSIRTGEGMQQTLLGFVTGGAYTLAFDYAGSNLWGGTDDIRWHLFIDNIEVDSTPVFNSLDTTWRTFQYTFHPTAVGHTIGVRCYTAGQPHIGGSGGIDNFRFIRIYTGEDELSNDLRINPVLVENELRFLGLTDKKYELKIYDVRGEMLLTNFISGSANTDISELSTGFYIYCLRDPEGRSSSGRLVKY